MIEKRREETPTLGSDSLAPESHLELRELLDEMPVGLQFVRGDGRILWANQAELDLVGCEALEYVGCGLGEFLTEAGAAETLLERLVAGERIEGHRTSLRLKDGSIRRVVIDGSALFRDGRFVHARLVTRDLTDLLETEQGTEMEETHRLNDQFLALLSHELRSPLGTILVWLELLQRGELDRDASMRAMASMERGARALASVIEDLLHASQFSASGEPVSSDEAPLAGLKVLYVDDEEDAREGLRRTLQQHGMAVTTAASAQEGLELVESLEPDVLLSDLAMPGEDGLSLIRRVRVLPLDRGGRIPAAALSAYAGAEARRKALLAGFQHYIRKPVDPEHLLSVISAMVRQA